MERRQTLPTGAGKVSASGYCRSKTGAVVPVSAVVSSPLPLLPVSAEPLPSPEPLSVAAEPSVTVSLPAETPLSLLQPARQRASSGTLRRRFGKSLRMDAAAG